MADQNDLLYQVETRATQKQQIPEFKVGDTVDVGVRIVEGEKTRIQIFNGVVISRRGSRLREYFTVRRIVDGEGVERDFPLHSPAVVDVKVKRHGAVRRAKLFYLRDRVGKATRLREKIEEEAEVADAAPGAAEAKHGKKRGKKAKAERKIRAAAAADAAAKAKAERIAQAGKNAGKGKEKAAAAEAKSE